MTRGPGEGRAAQAGRDGPRRDWQGQKNARPLSLSLSLSQVLLVDGSGFRFWTFDLLTLHTYAPFDRWLALGGTLGRTSRVAYLEQ